jgi:predicted Fe-Mo cluster-binding NifX family protein
MSDLEKAGISMKQVTGKLLDDAIKLFDDAFTQLHQVVEQKRAQP